jgi:D-alanyl-D-alanine carboxypeptidase
VLGKIKSGVPCVSDQGTDSAGPAGSTGEDESGQVTDVANDETVAVDGSAPSNAVRAEAGKSAGTSDRTLSPNNVADGAEAMAPTATGTRPDPVAMDAASDTAAATATVETEPDDAAGRSAAVAASATATERPKAGGPRLQPQKPAVHTGRATVAVHAVRPPRPDARDDGTGSRSDARDRDGQPSDPQVRGSAPLAPAAPAAARTSPVTAPAPAATPQPPAATPQPPAATPQPDTARPAATTPEPGPTAESDRTQVTKAAVRPPAPDSAGPKAAPLRPVTSVPGVSGRAKVTGHRPATLDRDEVAGQQAEHAAATRDAAADPNAPARNASARNASARNAPAPNASARNAPAPNASAVVATGRDAAGRDVAAPATSDATGRTDEGSSGAGVSRGPGAVGRARVASTSRSDAAARRRVQAEAVARETAGLEAARLAARAAAEKAAADENAADKDAADTAEKNARELAGRAAREQRIAHERAVREWRERALSEQRAREAAQAAVRAEELRAIAARRDSSAPAGAADRESTAPQRSARPDARAGETVRIAGTGRPAGARYDGDESATAASAATPLVDATTTTEASDRTVADRARSEPADGRTRGSQSDRRRRRRRIATVTGAVVAVIMIAIVATVVITKASSYSAAPPIAPAPKIEPPGPVLAGVNTSAEVPTAAGLTAALAGPLADKRLGSHISVAVRDVATGRLLYGHGASSPTTPASSMKLATATALLGLRGPNYRITTSVVAGARPGEVVLVGAGDPTLAAGPKSTYPESGRLDVLADEVKRALGGVKPTRVIIDTTLFSGPATSTGWQDSDADSTYVHPIYALTTDGGRIDPTKTGNSERYPNSALAAGQTFAKLLGLPPTSVATGRTPTAATGVTGTAPGAVLASVQSAPLVRILDTMLTDSDNVLAEFMARQVAIAVHRPASFAGAAAAVTAELNRLGLPTAGTHIVDGSGVSHQDRLTPALLTALLTYDAQPNHSRFHPVFSGLPIAGWSGTLADRFTSPTTNPAAGVLRAKTGTLDGVSALAGIVVDASGRSLAFAVMVDKVPLGLDAPSAEDVIGAALYRCGCAG